MAYLLQGVDSWEEVLEDFRPGTDLFKKANDLFNHDRPIFLVQSEMVKRWLELRFSDLGWVFLPNWNYSASLFKNILIEQIGLSHKDIIQPIELSFLALKFEISSSYAEASQIAKLLNQYADNFAELLAKPLESLGPNNPVIRLWSICRQEGRYPLGWHLFQQAIQDRPLPENRCLPAIVVMGAPFLTFSEQAFLIYLSRHTEVTHYMLRPANLGSEKGRGLFDQMMAYYQDQKDRGRNITILKSSEASAPRPKEMRLTSCWGPRRELEIAVEDVLGLLEDEPDLQPHQIGVIALDWNTYYPYLEVILGSEERSRGGYSGEKTLLGSPALPYQLESVDPVWEDFFYLVRQWLGFIRGDWTSTSLKRYLGHPWVQRHLELDTHFDWDHWCRIVQFHWGYDPSQVERSGKQIVVYPSLQDAWGRFVELLDYSEGKAAQLPQPSWQQVLLYSRVVTHFNLLNETLSSFQETATWGQRLESFKKLLAEFLASPNLEPAARKCFEYLGERLETESVWYKDLNASSRDLVDFIEPLLQHEGYRPQLLVNGLSLGSFYRLRSIPFDTLIILGLDENFPREGAPHPQDILYHPNDWVKDFRERREALSQTHRDRELWFEMLALTRKRLWFYYTGQDLSSDERKRPSPLVKELSGFSLVKRSTEMYHFNRTQDESEETYYARYASIARALNSPKLKPQHWQPTSKVVDVRHLSLRARLRSIEYPLEEWAKMHLGYQSPYPTDNLSDQESWELDVRDYLYHILDHCQKNMVPKDDVQKLSLELFEQRLRQGSTGVHRDKINLPDPNILDCEEVYNRVYDKLQNLGSLRPIQVFFEKRPVYVGFTAEECHIVALGYNQFNMANSCDHYDSFLIRMRLSLLWDQIKSNFAPTVNKIKVWVWTDKKEMKCQEFEPFDEVRQMLDQLSSFFISSPCLVPLHESDQLEKVLHGDIEALYQDLVAIWHKINLGKNTRGNQYKSIRFKKTLDFLIQDFALPESTPDWFVNSVKKLRSILEDLNCG